jgi:hypothetical protein
MKEKYFIVSEDEQGKNPYVISTDSSTPDFEIAGPFNSIFAAQNKLKKLTKNKKEWGGTAESSETGAFIGGENASSMYNTGGGVDNLSIENIYKELKKSANFEKVELVDSKDSSTGKEIYILSKLEAHPDNDLHQGRIDEFAIYYEGKDLIMVYLVNGYDEEAKTMKDILDFTRANEMAKGGGVGSYVKEDKAFQDFKIELEKKYGKGYKNSDLSEKDFDKLFNLKERRSKSYVNKLPIENARNNMAKGGPLKGNQNKLDLNKNGKLDAEDFKMLRSKKMVKGGGVDSHYEKMIKDNWENISYAWETGGKKVPNSISSSDAEDFLNDFDSNFSNMNEEEQSKAITKFKNAFKAVRVNKMENGGTMNETFPDTDAMSYAGGGGVSDSDFERDYKKVKQHIKEGYGNIDSGYVESTWENLSDITYSAIDDKLMKRLSKDGLLNYAQGGLTSGWCYSIGGL